MSPSRLRAVDIALVAAGGVLGALARLGVDSATSDSLFPWPTLLRGAVAE